MQLQEQRAVSHALYSPASEHERNGSQVLRSRLCASRIGCMRLFARLFFVDQGMKGATLHERSGWSSRFQQSVAQSVSQGDGLSIDGMYRLSQYRRTSRSSSWLMLRVKFDVLFSGPPSTALLTATARITDSRATLSNYIDHVPPATRPPCFRSGHLAN
jgi:hypothetical protein